MTIFMTYFSQMRFIKRWLPKSEQSLALVGEKGEQCHPMTAFARLRATIFIVSTWHRWGSLDNGRKTCCLCSLSCTPKTWWLTVSVKKPVKGSERLWPAQGTSSAYLHVDKVCCVMREAGPVSLKMLQQELSLAILGVVSQLSWQLCGGTSNSSTFLQRGHLFWGVVASSFLFLRRFLFVFTLGGCVLFISFCFVFMRT